MIDQYNTLAEKFLRKGFWLYFFSFIIAPMGYIIKIIISGEVTVSELGILYGIISLIVILSAYNDLGMTESINHFIPRFVTEERYDKVKSILLYAFILQVITGLSIAGFFFFGSEFIANNYFKTEKAREILEIFALYFIGINIFQIFTMFFLAIQNTFYNKIGEFVRMVFTLVFVLFFFVFDYSSLINFSYAWIIGLYIGTIFYSYFFYTKYFKTYLKNEKILWDLTFFKTVLKYGLFVFLGAQAATILSQVDMQMIILLLGTTEAGYYTNYLSIITIPFMIIGPIFGFLLPIFSEMYSKGEYGKILLVKSSFQKNFLLLAIAFNLLFFIFAETIAFILFGEQFITSGTILQYSILFVAFNFLLQINFNILAGIGRVKERVKIISIAIVFNIVGNFILIKLMGVNGAALATALGWILIYMLSEKTLGKTYAVGFDYRVIFKNITIMGLIGSILFIFREYIFGDASRFESFIYLGIISLLWFCIFTILNITEYKYFVKQIKQIKNG